MRRKWWNKHLFNLFRLECDYSKRGNPKYLEYMGSIVVPVFFIFNIILVVLLFLCSLYCIVGNNFLLVKLIGLFCSLSSWPFTSLPLLFSHCPFWPVSINLSHSSSAVISHSFARQNPSSFTISQLPSSFHSSVIPVIFVLFPFFNHPKRLLSLVLQPLVILFHSFSSCFFSLVLIFTNPFASYSVHFFPSLSDLSSFPSPLFPQLLPHVLQTSWILWVAV